MFLQSLCINISSQSLPRWWRKHLLAVTSFVYVATDSNSTCVSVLLSAVLTWYTREVRPVSRGWFLFRHTLPHLWCNLVDSEQRKSTEQLTHCNTAVFVNQTTPRIFSKGMVESTFLDCTCCQHQDSFEKQSKPDDYYDSDDQPSLFKKGSI